jgi:hypothetical protein
LGFIGYDFFSNDEKRWGKAASFNFEKKSLSHRRRSFFHIEQEVVSIKLGLMTRCFVGDINLAGLLTRENGDWIFPN